MLEGEGGGAFREIRLVQFCQIVVLSYPKPEIFAEVFAEAVDSDGLHHAALSSGLVYGLWADGGFDGDSDECEL